MKKDLAIIFGLFLLIAILLIFGKGFTTASFFTPSTAPSTAVSPRGFINVSVKTLNVTAKVNSKASDRKEGLSGKDSLPINEGMLFVFDSKGFYPFWMKDMKFPIDIIWIDENKNIVSIAASVVPEPGKDDSALSLYKPTAEALYVLEINAGLSVLHNVQVGDQVNFEL